MATPPRASRAPAAPRALPWWALVLLVVLLGVVLSLYQTQRGTLLDDAARAGLDLLPRLALAVAVLLGAVVAVGVLRLLLRRAVPREGQRRPLGTVAAYAVYAVAAIVALSSLAGEFSGVAISLGLVGFGLTLALQTPILNAVAWLLVQTKRLYAPGDRVRIGELRGDVMEVGALVTTLWEFSDGAGGHRPTGRRVTFPNKLVLEQPVVNYSADFPYVWDRLEVPVAMEGDWRLARELVLKAADEVVGAERMAALVEEYQRLLARSFQPYDLPRRPTVALRLDDSWLTLVLRYLVHVDELGPTRTRIIEQVLDSFAAHPEALPPVYPHIQSMRIDGRGRPAEGAPEM